MFLEKNYRLQDIQLSKNCWLAIRSSPTNLSWPTSALRATVGILRVHSRAKDGGEYRARTGDLLVANQALSQLS